MYPYSEVNGESSAKGSAFCALEVSQSWLIGKVLGDLTTCMKLGYPAFPTSGTPFLSIILLWEIMGFISGNVKEILRIRRIQYGEIHSLKKSLTVVMPAFSATFAIFAAGSTPRVITPIFLKYCRTVPSLLAISTIRDFSFRPKRS